MACICLERRFMQLGHKLQIVGQFAWKLNLESLTPSRVNPSIKYKITIYIFVCSNCICNWLKGFYA